MQQPQQTKTSDTLQRLAARLGLSSSYISASGEPRVVDDRTLRALCAASGYPADSDDDAQQALARLDSAGARLDPVFVLGERGLVDTSWRGSAAVGQLFDWQIVTEQGAAIDGRGELESPSEAPAGGRPQTRLRLALPELLIGYHQIKIRCAGEDAQAVLIIAPPCAYTPPQWQTEQRRDWAITTQLYSLRSQRNWGIGDFSDLGQLARHAAGLGASAIGLSPLHALFAANPRHLSPYSPSSRVFLNAVFIDVEAVPEFADSAAARELVASANFQSQLAAVRASEFVDYEAVWSLKLQVLELVFAEFHRQRNLRPGGERARVFQSFKDMWGLALTRFARFEVLQRHFVELGLGVSWHVWPEAFRDVDSAEVAAFADAHQAAVDFSEFLQWEADRQLGEQAGLMRDAGMTTGVYRDLAVGVDPNGAEAWSDQSLLVSGATVGAPPDIYNTQGQDWGLTPFSPQALRQSAYAAFIATIRANMRHAGALRIDHVLGLKRLFWVPHGLGAKAGSYVSFPFEDLMGIIALESQRNQCLVVGEDLGTVPDGFREDAERRGLLSYRVLMFERENGDGAFLPPSHYPELAAAAVSTHDLPTLAGMWAGRDLDWRNKLSICASAEDESKERVFRESTRNALVDALGLRDGRQAAADADVAALIAAAHRYLAQAPSKLLLVQIEDIAGEIEQMNMPGTVDEHPNWRRKLGRTIDELFNDAAVLRLAGEVSQARAARQSS